MPEYSGRVLVVDDIPANVRLLSGILKVAGYEVVTAGGGEEGLQQVQATSPDVVLLDIMMPDMDGFEVCRRIKANPETSWLPVVIVTALQETADRVAAIEAGADDFLTKPVDEVEVEARVKSLVRVKRQRDDLENAYKELRRAEAMRDGLAAMMVHDLRTPLTAILGSLETMRIADPNEFQLELVDICSRSSNRLLSIVNDLLDVSKMESGQMKLMRAPIQIAGLIEDSLDQIAPREGEKRITRYEREIELSVELGENLPVLQADYDLLSRVIINLVGNAIKFEPRGGTVTISAVCDANSGDANSGDASTPDAPGVLFKVRDNGPGVPPEDQERIFDKFGQVESSLQGRKLSTGLGLTFCKLAVEAHGGKIWIESTPGEGSHFYFTIPLGGELWTATA